MDSRNAENDIVGPIGSGRLDPFLRSWQKWNHGSDLISPLGEAGEIDVKLATLLDRVLKPTGELAKGVPVVSCGQLLHCERSESIKKTQYFLVLPGKSSKYIRDAVYIVLPSCLRLTRNMISVYNIYIYIIYIYIVVWRYCSWGWA